MKKRILALLAVLCLVVSLSATALAAESATATTLRMKSTEGTVTLTNQNGKKLSLREDMKLYSGYTVTTDAASYAYISLDDTKAVKLDASSSAEIKKNGKQLEVLLKSGNLFFNVTAPLESDETLNIRTSTMVTGIRGTAGAVTQSSVYLLDGAVVLHTLDSATGEVLSTPLSAGQLATTDAGTNTLHTEVFSAEELPGFAGTEVAKDPVLQEKIAQETKLDVAQILQIAPDKLAQEQAAQRAAADKVASAVASQPPVKTAAPPVTKPVRPTEDAPSAPGRDDNGSSDDTSGSDDDSGSDNSGVPPDTLPGTPPTEITLGESTTGSAIQAALNQSGVTTVRLQATSPVDLTDGLTIPAGKALCVDTGELSLPYGQDLSIDGRLDIASGVALSITGRVLLSAGGSVENNGAITLQATGNWQNRGTLRSYNDDAFLCNGTFLMYGGLVHSEAGYALQSPSGCAVPFSGGLFSSSVQADAVGPNVSLQGLDGTTSTPVLSGLQGTNTYLKGVGLNGFLAELGSTPTTIYLEPSTWVNQNIVIGPEQDITLTFLTSGGVLSYRGELSVAGALTLSNGAISFGSGTTLTLSGNLTMDDSAMTFASASTFTASGNLTTTNSFITLNSGSTFTSSAAAVLTGSIFTSSGTSNLTTGSMEFATDSTLIFSPSASLNLDDCHVWSASAAFCPTLPTGFLIEHSGDAYILTRTP